MNEEIWKDIIGYEGLYQVSNLGRVKSLERYNRRNIKIPEKILVGCVNYKGYHKVLLCKDGRQKQYSVHRLVMNAFVPNPNNYPVVNHKDENKLNNNVDNLEWCTVAYNNTYGNALEKARKTRKTSEKWKARNTSYKKPIEQCDLQGNLIKRWDSSIDAEKGLGLWSSHIRNCCRGEGKTCGGYIWRYANKSLGVLRNERI